MGVGLAESRDQSLWDRGGLQTRVLGEPGGPFRDDYFEDPAYRLEVARVPGSYAVRDGTDCERLTVLEGTLPV